MGVGGVGGSKNPTPLSPSCQWWENHAAASISPCVHKKEKEKKETV